MKKIFLSFFLIFSSFSFLNAYSVNEKGEVTLTFGVVPQQSPLQMIKVWKPIVEELSKKTGYKINLKIEKSIPTFEKKLYAGYYDIAYSNPYHYVLANKYQNHQAIVKFKKDIQGILVAKKDSKIENIEDFKGKEFLFPAPKAFAATILTKYELLEKGINIEESKKFKYVNSHDSVYLGIDRKIGDIGGGIMRTFNNNNNNKIKDNLKIIYKTNRYPSHPISVSGKLEYRMKSKIEFGLLSISSKLTNNVKKGGITITYNSEYKEVKELAKKLRIYRK